MKNLLIITPVKDSIETALDSIAKVCAAKGSARFIVYNDYSTANTCELLEGNTKIGYELINIEEQTTTPSPNYRFTLIDARKKAIENNAALLIIESDVFITQDTISALYSFAENAPACGMVAAITVDESGKINFPYEHIKPDNRTIIESKHRLSFCCTLLTLPLLKALDFEVLLPKHKHWFDVLISRSSRQHGFKNFVLPQVQVVHKPHGSRPWKLLKYSSPIKYYLRKWFLGLDKI